MKTLVITLVASVILLAPSHAGMPIQLSEVPETVTKVIAEYFPGSEALSAEKETDDGRTKFEVRIQYKDIRLEVDVSPEGKILDLDMQN